VGLTEAVTRNSHKKEPVVCTSHPANRFPTMPSVIPHMLESPSNDPDRAPATYMAIHTL
jgi:hypothetical protein